MMFVDLKGRRRKLPRYFKYKIDWESDSRSKLQTQVKKELFNYWEGEFVYEELPVLGTKLTIDFFNSSQNIAIEVDGKQHFEFNKFFHNNNRNIFLDQIKRDEKKEIFCSANNITLYRIQEGEDIEKTLKKILNG